MVSHSHRPTPHPSRKWLWAALVIVLVGGAAAIALAMKKSPRSAAAGCPHPIRQLQVAAAPDIAPAVAAVARTVEFSDCNPTRIRVRAVDSAAQAATLAGARGTRRSGSRTRRVNSRRCRARSSPRVRSRRPRSSSPSGLGGSRPRRASDLRRGRRSGHDRPSVRVGGRRSGGFGADARHARRAARLADRRARAAPATSWRCCRTPRHWPRAMLPARPDVINGAPIAVPTHRTGRLRRRPGLGRVHRRVPPVGAVLDYPFVVMGTRVDRDSAALLSTLTSAKGRGVLAAYGFRSASGVPGAALRTTSGVDAAAPSAASPSQADAARCCRRCRCCASRRGCWRCSTSRDPWPTRCPGWQAAPASRWPAPLQPRVSGCCRPRARWACGASPANLTRSTDYQQLVPVTPLSDATRSQLAGAVGQFRARCPTAAPGCTTPFLARCSRCARTSTTPGSTASWCSPTARTSSAKHAVTLSTLLSALKAESASKQPVKVIAIAYGPDTDTGALRAIATASGGILYTSADPRDLPQIFRNAIGRRV